MNTEALRRALLADRDALLCRHAERPEPEPPGNHVDAAVAHAAREQGGLDHERVRARVQAIDEALARMDAGTFGSCVDCGGDIAARRLTEHPTAARCIGCESAHERQQVRRRPVADDEEAC